MSSSQDEIYTDQQLEQGFDSREVVMAAFANLHATHPLLGSGPVFPDVPDGYPMPRSFLRVEKLSELLRCLENPQMLVNHMAKHFSQNMFAENFSFLKTTGLQSQVKPKPPPKGFMAPPSKERVGMWRIKSQTCWGECA